jgi:hypothetical protein
MTLPAEYRRLHGKITTAARDRYVNRHYAIEWLLGYCHLRYKYGHLRHLWGKNHLVLDIFRD